MLRKHISFRTETIMVYLVGALLFIAGIVVIFLDVMLGLGLTVLGALTVGLNKLVFGVKTLKVKIDTRARAFNALVQIVAGIYCELATLAIQSKLISRSSVSPNLFLLLLIIFALSILFGKMMKEHTGRIFVTFMKTLIEDKGDVERDEGRRLGWDVIDKIVDSIIIKHYFQSAIIFSVFGSVLVTVSTHLDLVSLWFLLFFEFCFALLLFTLALLFDARKITYPIAYEGVKKGGAVYVSLSNLHEVDAKDAVLAKIINQVFHAWLLITLLLYLVA